mmetsp:Transcript_123033/g.184034  ORF Transcript_123033/g.184034 Transcript_123033/m.184034 type:complete len:229 (-) Transcript_123033:75-761(-)
MAVHYGAVDVGAERTRNQSNRKLVFAGSALLLSAVAVIAVTLINGSAESSLLSVNEMSFNQALNNAEKETPHQLRQSLAQTSQLARGSEKREKGVPATVLAPPPEPADWDGSVAVIGKMPPLGNAPSQLTEAGFETRGSITVRRDLAGENEYFRIYGRINHHLKCTLRGYRRLLGEFNHEVIYTGFKRVWVGQSQIHPPHLQRGQDNEFDVITCRDLDTGEVQYFKVK